MLVPCGKESLGGGKKGGGKGKMRKEKKKKKGEALRISKERRRAEGLKNALVVRERGIAVWEWGGRPLQIMDVRGEKGAPPLLKKEKSLHCNV